MRVYHSPLLRNRPFSEIVPSSKTYKSPTHTRLTHARARLPTAMLIFCCHKCHTLPISPPFFLPPFALSPHHFFRSDIDPQTTRCFL